MLGAIIGDIVGSLYEFNNTQDYNFPLFSQKGSFTDDTICTIAVADALLSGADFGSSLRRWCNAYPHPMGGYGVSYAAWLHASDPKPYYSFGNGAAMRVSPVGWAFDTEAETLRFAMYSADCTHNHPEGLIGASLVARTIFKLRKNGKFSRKEVQSMLESCYGPDWHLRLPKPGQFDETCQGCVPLAFHIIGESSSFENAVRLAVTYGGDSDTLAAIVGSIAEAIWGIPDTIKRRALEYLPGDMIDVVNRFKNRFNYE